MIFIGSVACCENYSGYRFMLVSGIYGAEWGLMRVVLLWRFGLAVVWGVVFCVKYVVVVDVDVRMHGCCGITVEDGDDCGW